MSVSFGIQGSGQQLGSSVPDGGRLRDLAQAAEELGYDSIWAGDHISYRNPILDVVVALSTFAAATERITIGAGIVLLPLRHPSVVAKEFASLDHVSGGRVILGVGVGGESAKDFEAVGVDPRERGARTDEAMQALRELFRGHASFSGRFFSFEDVEIEPGPARPGGPPLWVGGRSPAAIRRAAVLGDGWIPIWMSAERFREGLALLPAHVVPAVTLPCPRRRQAASVRASAAAVRGRLRRARRRPLLRGGDARGVRGAGARVRRRGCAAHRLQPRRARGCGASRGGGPCCRSLTSG